MSAFETKNMPKNPDLYSFSSLGMPDVKASHDALPPIVKAVFTDHEEIYADSALEAGICGHPQMASAITAECPEHYLAALLETKIEVGAAAVYGAILMRPTSYFDGALAVASDVLRDSGHLSGHDKHLLLYACDQALSARAPETIDQRFYRKRVDSYLGARNFVVGEYGQCEESVTEGRYPEFFRYRNIIDTINEASTANLPLDSSFFASAEPTTENYVKGFFALVSKADSEIHKSALDYFSKLDPLLLEMFKLRFEDFYFAKK